MVRGHPFRTLLVLLVTLLGSVGLNAASAAAASSTTMTTTDTTVTLSQPLPALLSPSLDAFAALDTQLTHFTAKVSCPSDPSLSPSPSCPVILTLTWRRMNLRTGKPFGPSTALGSSTATVNAGQGQTMAMTVPPGKLRDRLFGTRTGALVYATLTDQRNGQRVDQLQTAGEPGAFSFCPGPAYVRFSGGPIMSSERDATGKISRQPVLSGQIGESEELDVGNSPVRFTVLGVEYQVSAHAVFDRTCWGLSDYHRGQFAPTVVLDAGTIHAVGTPHGAQIWVGVGTPEGNLGSRSQERVDFTVSRDPKAQVSVMRVKVGQTTQVTPFDTPTRSLCTNGQALSVDRHGHIRQL